MSEAVAADSSRSRSKIIPIMIVAVVVLCGIFGWRTVKARRDFDAYRIRTLIDEADQLPWAQSPQDVEACIDYALEWTLECPAMDTWCHSYMPDVLGRCLDSQPRDAFCATGVKQEFGTSYGYHECEARVAQVDQKYRKRATKKICVRAKKAVLAYCSGDHAETASRK